MLVNSVCECFIIPQEGIISSVRDKNTLLIPPLQPPKANLAVGGETTDFGPGRNTIYFGGMSLGSPWFLFAAG